MSSRGFARESVGSIEFVESIESVELEGEMPKMS